MVLAIEPMVTRGGEESVVLDDGWTVVMTDGSRTAHYEHTLVVTEDGYRLLTIDA
jgi:methionyl aminopeptidase